MIYRVAHVSDIHLPPLPDASLAELISKRILGYASWQVKRKDEHLVVILDNLKKDIDSFGFEHVCITGDLTNIALPDEFRQAAGWLSSLAPGQKLALVPGNHDAYVPGALQRGLVHWRPWLGDAVPDGDVASFPRLWRRGPVDFIGVSTAVATPPFMASGRIGRRQMARLGAVLQSSAKDDRIRILMLHHPPDAGAEPWRKALRDGASLRRLLRKTGVELVLHGHSHYQRRTSIAGPSGDIPVLGAGSASSLGRRKGAGHYHRLSLDTSQRPPVLRVEHRVFDPEKQAFTEGGREEIRIRVQL